MGEVEDMRYVSKMTNEILVEKLRSTGKNLGDLAVSLVNDRFSRDMIMGVLTLMSTNQLDTRLPFPGYTMSPRANTLKIISYVLYDWGVPISGDLILKLKKMYKKNFVYPPAR